MWSLSKTLNIMASKISGFAVIIIVKPPKRFFVNLRYHMELSKNENQRNFKDDHKYESCSTPRLTLELVCCGVRKVCGAGA